ncbi:MAG: hypothetical protein ACREBE_22320, partial [bacterium]
MIVGALSSPVIVCRRSPSSSSAECRSYGLYVAHTNLSLARLPLQMPEETRADDRRIEQLLRRQLKNRNRTIGAGLLVRGLQPLDDPAQQKRLSRSRKPADEKARIVGFAKEANHAPQRGFLIREQSQPVRPRGRLGDRTIVQ